MAVLIVAVEEGALRTLRALEFVLIRPAPCTVVEAAASGLKNINDMQMHTESKKLNVFFKKITS